MLRVENISKSFSGVQALQNVNLELFSGLVTAIVGENGAGKSTLMKILSGVYADYEGKLFFHGEEVNFSDPKAAQDKGIGIIHQELNLIPHLSIRENIFLGREILTAMGFLDVIAMRNESQALMKKLHLNMDPETPIHQLKVGQQQLVEIAKALSMDCQVIIMDEPTSAISENEVEVLFKIIRELKSEGKAIAYISHKLDELFEIAERYLVLRDGQMIEQGEMKEMSKEILVRKMVGRPLQIHRNATGRVFGESLFQVNNLQLKDPLNKDKPLLKGIDFELFKGEVLGIFGLMGAGRTELLETLFGMHADQYEGTISIGNIPCQFKNTQDAMKVGLALVPEDRKADGLVLGMDIVQNTSLAVLNNMITHGLLDQRKEEELAERYIAELWIKATSPRQIVENLSGGNQQKVVLSKWLATKPKVLMLDEPTRGIDINAKNEIYKLIHQLALEGLGLIVVSSELPEILSIADRVLVMAEGKMTANIPIDENTSEDMILTAALPQLT